MLLPSTPKSDVISASQQPEGAMVMTDHSSSDGSFLPLSFSFYSVTLLLPDCEFGHPRPDLNIKCRNVGEWGPGGSKKRKRGVIEEAKKRRRYGGKEGWRSCLLLVLSYFQKLIHFQCWSQNSENKLKNVLCVRTKTITQLQILISVHIIQRRRNSCRFIYWNVIWQEKVSSWKLVMNMK